MDTPTLIVLPNTPYPSSTSIKLQTAKKTDIENSQIFEISQFERNQFPKFKKWANDAIPRATPTPRYNCHGMTFASRRTCVAENSAIQTILREDEYSEVEFKDILPGDVIIYFSQDGDAEHSGIISELPEKDDIVKIPKIISKWGKYSEFIHRANNCPYDFSRVKYYRIKG